MARLAAGNRWRRWPARCASSRPLAPVRARSSRPTSPTASTAPVAPGQTPNHTSSFEFCENGAKAVAWEATSKTVGPEFFAQHTVSGTARAERPLARGPGPPRPPDALRPRHRPLRAGVLGRGLRASSAAGCSALGDPHAAAFYTSGRTSNEAAFLYQLFVREFGTNNLPDCSNLCHEATSVGLPLSIGVGKGTVQLADFAVDGCGLHLRPQPRHATIRGCSRRCARWRGAESRSSCSTRCASAGWSASARRSMPAEMLTGGVHRSRDALLPAAHRLATTWCCRA